MWYLASFDMCNEVTFVLVFPPFYPCAEAMCQYLQVFYYLLNDTCLSALHPANR